MIHLYTSPTPNGWKASVMLEELGVAYRVVPIDLAAGDQKQPDYVRLNPNGRIPTIVDDEVESDSGGLAVFESGAILIYLAEKYGRFLATDIAERSRTIQWLMFQMGGVGPMMGQANVFFRYLPEKIQPAIDRYQSECRRLFEVLDTRLQERDYLCDGYSIADIANWCWVRTHPWSGVSVEGLDALQAWLDRIGGREAVARGLEVPGRASAEEITEIGAKIIQTGTTG